MDYRDIIRRLLATLAFRTRYVFQDAPEGFYDFEAGMDSRTPLGVLNHVIDLIVVTGQIYRGEKPESKADYSDLEVLEAFQAELARCDNSIKENQPVDTDTSLRLVQGPIADALTHIGQAALMRRLFGSPVDYTNFYRADMKVGQAGPKHPAPKA
jgi:hypothetical protein